MFDSPIRLHWRDLGSAFLVGLAAWSLNEFVFYEEIPSLVVRCLVVPVFVVALFRSPLAAAKVIIFLGIALDYRPRGVHLIPLLERGDYEFFSPNAASFPGISMSLTTLFMVIPLRGLLPGLTRIRMPASVSGWILLGLLVWGTCIGLAAGLIAGPFEPGRYLTDLKYPLFILSGFAVAMVTTRDEAVHFGGFIVWLGVVVAVITAANGAIDLVLGRFLLNYNTALFFSVGALAVTLTAADLKNWPTRIGALVIAVSSIPLTRGEQLILGLNLLLVLGVLLAGLRQPGMAVRRLTLAGFAGGILFSAVLVIVQQSEDTARFFTEKFELFRSLGQVLDKSTLVRVAEFEATLPQDDITQLPALLVGKGFGGSFALGKPFAGLALDYADYSSDELAQGRAYHPHFFLTYWLLKFGLLGTILFWFFHVLPIARSKGLPRLILLCFLGPVIWQGFWVPVYAFIAGLLTGIVREGES